MNFIRLATPTTDDKRLPAVLANTSGFVYYVSITGITGSAAANSAAVGEAVGRIKRHTSLPVCVGFGIRTPDAARGIAERSDGAVVGSALVDVLSGSLDAEGKATAETVNAVAGLAASLAEGVRSAKRVRKGCRDSALYELAEGRNTGSLPAEEGPAASMREKAARGRSSRYLSYSVFERRGYRFV